jgi:hypothetical protein
VTKALNFTNTIQNEKHIIQQSESRMKLKNSKNKLSTFIDINTSVGSKRKGIFILDVYVYMCVCVCGYVCVDMYVCECVCVCVWVYLCI